MDKQIVISVSPYVHKYYLNEDFKDLPDNIKDEVRAKLAVVAEKVNCIITLGFYEDGEIFIEERHEDVITYDDIGAGLELKKLQMEEKEMFKALKLWYMVYKTQNGKIVREIVILQAQQKSEEEILKTIEAKYGEESKLFAKQLLVE